MRILRRFIEGAAFWLTGVSLLTLGAWNSQAQVPAKKSEPQARILVGKEAMPTQTEVQQQPARPSQPLSLEEKRRFFRPIINSLAAQSKLYPGQNFDQAFSPNVWKPNFDVLPSPPTLTARQPWVNKVGWLDFNQPEFVGKHIDGGKEQFLAAGRGKFLTVNLDAAQGTYLLDFTVDAYKDMKVVEGAPANLSMQIDLVNGHLLVPLFAPKAGLYTIELSCSCLHWTFFSVEIDQVK